MLDVRELDEAIAELEAREPTFSSCSKLADLYTVRKHLFGPDDEYERSNSKASIQSKEPVQADVDGDSDFLRVVSGKNSAEAWAVMDDLMDTLHVANERVYDSVMRKMRGLQIC